MSVVIEAFYLPLIMLTVAFLGGLRVAGRVILMPPPLFTLVLAMLLLGILIRSAALAPERLMNAARSPAANLSGLVVLIATFLASAQAFNLATPESGLPRLPFSVFLFVLLLNTMAASSDRIRTLRSLAVTFGSAFVLKFIVLAAISDPAGGRLKRILLVMLEGLTLGTLTQDTFHPITGCLAFFTFVLFVVGLSLLPGRAEAPSDVLRLRSHS
jgi:hypothetical protein